MCAQGSHKQNNEVNPPSSVPEYEQKNLFIERDEEGGKEGVCACVWGGGFIYSHLKCLPKGRIPVAPKDKLKPCQRSTNNEKIENGTE